MGVWVAGCSGVGYEVGVPRLSTHDKLAGEGAPVVDVMVRQKSERELFLFVMNLGGAGAGEVRLNLPGHWLATGAMQPAAPVALGAVMPLRLKAWEYRVWRVTR